MRSLLHWLLAPIYALGANSNIQVNKQMAELFNRDIQDIISWLHDVESEMRASQSSRLHRGFIDGEKRRVMELLDDLVKRIEGMKTGDFPETHPMVLEGEA